MCGNVVSVCMCACVCVCHALCEVSITDVVGGVNVTCGQIWLSDQASFPLLKGSQIRGSRRAAAARTTG